MKRITRINRITGVDTPYKGSWAELANSPLSDAIKEHYRSKCLIISDNHLFKQTFDGKLELFVAVSR